MDALRELPPRALEVPRAAVFAQLWPRAAVGKHAVGSVDSGVIQLTSPTSVYQVKGSIDGSCVVIVRAIRSRYAGPC